MEISIWKSMGSCLGIFVVFTFLRVVYSIWWRPRSFEKQFRQQGITGTRYKLFFGDAKAMEQSFTEARAKPSPLNHSIVRGVLPFNLEMVKRYGKVSVCWWYTRPTVVITDAELMRKILTVNIDHFINPADNPLSDILTKGLSYLSGEKWANRRKLLKLAFHYDKLKEMGPAFLVSCQTLIDRWKSLVGPRGTCELDVMTELENFTGDVISRTAFGSSYEEGKRLFEFQKEQTVLSMEAFRCFYIPGSRFLPTKKNKRRYYLDSEIKAILKKIIQKRKQTMKNIRDSGIADDDLLGLLLQCQEQTKIEMTEEDVIEECKLFYFAAETTIAMLLTWTIVVLSMHPNWQEKAREEVLKIYGKKVPDSESIHHLKIVSMILHEVLRLYPPTYQQFRRTGKRIDIEGMSIPAGVDIELSTMLLHHSEEYWGDDVEEFKPERFSEGVSKASKGDQIAFYPFGWGHRICLGQGFAMLEAKMILSVILQHFWFELSPTYTHAPHPGIALEPQYGAPIILHRI